MAYPVHRKRAIPSAGRHPLRFSSEGARRRKGRKRKGREGKEGEGREGRRKEEEREEKKKDGKENKTSGGAAEGGEWTRGWVGGADGNGQQHSRGSPRGKFIP